MAIDKEKVNASLIASIEEDGTDVQSFLDACRLIVKTLSRAEIANAVPKAEVYSARALKVDELEKISAYITEKLGVEARLENKIDKSLISGIKIVCGDKVIDGSLKSRLDALKNSLEKA